MQERANRLRGDALAATGLGSFGGRAEERLRWVDNDEVPKDIQALIRQMATENPTWGQEHIANELKLKLGIRVSPRTVGKYLGSAPAASPTRASAG